MNLLSWTYVSRAILSQISDVRLQASILTLSELPSAILMIAITAEALFFLPEIKSIVQELKNASDAPVVMGGVGFSISPEHVMEYCNADYGIAGEGEEAFVILLSALKNGISLSQVPNLLYREDGKIRKKSMAYADLDSIPSRQRDIVDNILYFKEGGQAGIETKRG